LEGYPDFQARITILLEAMDHQEIEALTSELTLAEVLVKPFRERNVAWQRTYQEVLQPSVNLRLLPVSRAIVIAAPRFAPSSRSNCPMPFMPLLRNRFLAAAF
jgi:hypothetical protein